MPSGTLLPGEYVDTGTWLVGNAASNHDFVVADDKVSSVLCATSLILIGAPFATLCDSGKSRCNMHFNCMHTGQPQQTQEHIVVSIGHNARLPEALKGTCVLGKPARELFTDAVAAPLEASWKDDTTFCSNLVAGGTAESETLLCSVPLPIRKSATVCLVHL
jgi:hypothetical protein